jgi:hypothetical protein
MKIVQMKPLCQCLRHFYQIPIQPQIIAEKAEEMASNLLKSAKSADKITKTWCLSR